MNVNIFEGSKKTVEKSGVGRAMEHQRTMLESVGVSVNAVPDSKAEVIHFNTVFPDSVIAAAIAKMRGQKVVYYGHSTMEDFKNSFIGSNLAAPLFKQWIKFCYTRGDVIITPTEYSKKLLESYNITKPIYAVSNGIDASFWKRDIEGGKRFRDKYGIPCDRKVVMSVGHYIGRKGITEFIDMARKMPDVTFVWMGYTDLHLVPREIGQAIKTAPSNVILPGFVSKEELRDAYNGSDIFAFMSHEETEGIVVLEALACGITTVVRDIPVYDGWLEHGEDVFKCANDNDFEVTVKGILAGNITASDDMGANVVKARSYEAIGNKLFNIYGKIGDTNKEFYGKINNRMLAYKGRL